MYFNLAKNFFQTQSFPTTDIFSYAYPDSPLHTTHQWLTYFIYYALWNFGELIGAATAAIVTPDTAASATAATATASATVTIFKALLVTAIAAISLQPVTSGFAKSNLKQNPVLKNPLFYLLFALATYAASFRFIERGSLFSDFFTIALIFYLRTQNQITKRLIVTLTITFLLWVQLHPGYPLGLLFLAAWAGYHFITNKKFRNKNILWLLVPVLSTAINPDGTDGALYPLRFALDFAPVFRQYNLEWMSTLHTAYQKAPEVICFYLLSAIAVVSYILKKPKFTIDSLFFFLSIVLGFYAMRFTLWSSFAIFGLSSAWINFSKLQFNQKLFQKAISAAFAAMAFVVLLVGYPSSSGWRHPGFKLDPHFYPDLKTIQFLKNNPIPGNLFSAHQISHFLIWNGVQPIYHHGFSTYMPLYRDELMQLEQSKSTFDQLVKKYNWTKFLVDKNASYKVFYQYMSADVHWQIVAEDDASYLIYYLPEAKR